MAAEVVRFLVTDKKGAYLDLTAGLGGHLLALSGSLDKTARLYGFDKDRQALDLANTNLSAVVQKVRLIEASYTELDNKAPSLEDEKFDGVLLDLGLSSLQLDDPKRGFSFRHAGPLDMRFDPEKTSRTAADLINSSDEAELAKIIATYGEEKHARKLARAIVRERQKEMIQTTADLAALVRDNIKGQYQVKSLARVFQAFRIAVNGELDCLKSVLPQIINRLKGGGRLVVLSYHSLEDRIVKHFFQDENKGCQCPPRLPVCVCGRVPTVKLLTRKVLLATEEEKNINTRARSVRFRAVERLAL